MGIAGTAGAITIGGNLSGTLDTNGAVVSVALTGNLTGGLGIGGPSGPIAIRR